MNILLIDTSYYNFYRFYATKQWYTCAHREEVIEDDHDWSQNVVFWQKFSKMFLENIVKFEKKLKVDKVIFARDCKRDDIWRMPFFSNYKGDREETYKKTNFQGGKVFKRCYTELIDPVIDNQKYYQIKIPNLEADDIIALSCKHIQSDIPNAKITVISSDHDLLQLITPNVTLMDAKMKSYNDKSQGSKKTDIALKCIVGDSSDSIPKIFPKVGPKTALKLIDNPQLLLDKFKQHEGSLDAFALNYILISFDNIPNDLEQLFIQAFNPFLEAFKTIDSVV